MVAEPSAYIRSNPKPMSGNGELPEECSLHVVENWKRTQHPQMGLPTWQRWEEMKSVYCLGKSHIFMLMGTHPFNKHFESLPTMCQILFRVPEKIRKSPSRSGRIVVHMGHVIAEAGPSPPTPPQGRWAHHSGDIWAGSWRMHRSLQVEEEGVSGSGIDAGEGYTIPGVCLRMAQS